MTYKEYKTVHNISSSRAKQKEKKAAQNSQNLQTRLLFLSRKDFDWLNKLCRIFSQFSQPHINTEVVTNENGLVVSYFQKKLAKSIKEHVFR